jgi:hypothetical protein
LPLPPTRDSLGRATKPIAIGGQSLHPLMVQNSLQELMVASSTSPPMRERSGQRLRSRTAGVLWHVPGMVPN